MPDEIPAAAVLELPKTSKWYVPFLRSRKDLWVAGEAFKSGEKASNWLTERCDDDACCRVVVVELPL